MTAESFETIMARNNTTTVPAAQRVINAGAKKPAETVNASVKKNNALIAAATLMLCFCLVSSASAASIQKRVRNRNDNNNLFFFIPKMFYDRVWCAWSFRESYVLIFLSCSSRPLSIHRQSSIITPIIRLRPKRANRTRLAAGPFTYRLPAESITSWKTREFPTSALFSVPELYPKAKKFSTFFFLQLWLQLELCVFEDGRWSIRERVRLPVPAKTNIHHNLVTVAGKVNRTTVILYSFMPNVYNVPILLFNLFVHASHMGKEYW